MRGPRHALLRLHASDSLAQEAMDETFLLSNIAPQVGVGFNRHCSFLPFFSREFVQVMMLGA